MFVKEVLFLVKTQILQNYITIFNVMALNSYDGFRQSNREGHGGDNVMLVILCWQF